MDIPNSVTSIGHDAFSFCSSLVTVNIPNSVTSIHYGTFRGCSSLVSVDIPNSVIYIYFSAFEKCENLKKIVIPGSVVLIGHDTFTGCTKLEEVILEDSAVPIDFEDNNKLGYWDFKDCPLREVYLGRNIVIDEITSNNKWSSLCSPFYENADIEIFSIGPSVSKCRSLCFNRCQNLQIINCFSITPP